MTHTFGDDRRVRPQVTKSAVTVAGNGFGYTSPKHSLTILELKLKR